MTPHRSTNEDARDPAVGRQERRDLDLALDAARVGHDDVAGARSVLLDRLTRHPDDFAATTALQALDRYAAGTRIDARSAAPARERDAVRNAGLSSVERMRGARAHAHGTS